MAHKFEDREHGLVDTLLADYGGGRTIDAEVTLDHPNRDTVIDIVMKLRRIIFPGYFRNQAYRVYTVRNHVSMLMEDVIFNLIRQISIVLVNSPEYQEASPELIAARAEEITFAFLEKIPEIRTYVKLTAGTYRFAASCRTGMPMNFAFYQIPEFDPDSLNDVAKLRKQRFRTPEIFGFTCHAAPGVLPIRQTFTIPADGWYALLIAIPNQPPRAWSRLWGVKLEKLP